MLVNPPGLTWVLAREETRESGERFIGAISGSILLVNLLLVGASSLAWGRKQAQVGI
jgi:hypothetical protein